MELKQTKVFVPISAADAVKKEGFILIATYSSTIKNDGSKLDFTHQELIEKEGYFLTKEELEKVINNHLDYLYNSNVIHDYKDGKCDFRAINN